MKTAVIILLTLLTIGSVYAESQSWYELKHNESYIADFLLPAGQNKKIEIDSAEPVKISFKTDSSFAPNSYELYQQLSRDYKGYVVRLIDNNAGNAITTVTGGGLQCQPRDNKINIEAVNLIDKDLKVVIYKEQEKKNKTAQLPPPSKPASIYEEGYAPLQGQLENIYRNYLKALGEKDIESVRKYLIKKNVEEMEKWMQKKQGTARFLNTLSLFSPKELTNIQEGAKGDEAILSAAAAAVLEPEKKHDVRILFKKEEGEWKIDVLAPLSMPSAENDLNPPAQRTYPKLAHLFEITDEKIKEAIAFGQKAKYTPDAWGGVDLGLNKFVLSGNEGYVKISTPFTYIAELAQAYARKRMVLSPEDAAKNKGQATIGIYLRFKEKGAVDKAKTEWLEEQMQCFIETGSKKIDLVEEGINKGFSCFNFNELMVFFSYGILQEMIADADTSVLVLRHPFLGEEKIQIDWTQIQ